jgi:hypothetical protein
MVPREVWGCSRGGCLGAILMTSVVSCSSWLKSRDCRDLLRHSACQIVQLSTHDIDFVKTGPRTLCHAMEPSFPHILNPQIASFGSMVDNAEVAQLEDSSIAPASNEFIQDTTALNGSRKRPISRIKSTYPRKRAIQACQKCRARRTKCNNVRPACSSCLDLGVECNYAESDPSRYVTSLSPYSLSAESV